MTERTERTERTEDVKVTAPSGASALSFLFVFSLLSAFSVLSVFSVLSAQRAPVLQQVKVRHPYYYREMFIPQPTTGPSSVAAERLWTTSRVSVVVVPSDMLPFAGAAEPISAAVASTSTNAEKTWRLPVGRPQRRVMFPSW